MIKDFFRKLAVVIAVLVSGLGLSLIFVVRVSVADFLMLLAAPITAVVLVPQKHWFRIAAFVFLVASIYGFGRIAAEIARNVLEQLPAQTSWYQYWLESVVYLLYGSIWLIWRWRSRGPQKVMGK